MFATAPASKRNFSLFRVHPFQCCTHALTRPHSFTHSVCPLPHSFTLSIARHFWGQNYMICICIRRLGREVEWGALRGSHRNPSCADDICISGDRKLRRAAIFGRIGLFAETDLMSSPMSLPVSASAERLWADAFTIHAIRIHPRDEQTVFESLWNHFSLVFLPDRK